MSNTTFYSFKGILNRTFALNHKTINPSLVTDVLGKMIFGMVCLLLFATPVGATEAEGILDAGLIEWGDGYVKAVDGFEFTYDGKRVYGDQLYIDTNTNATSLDQIHFTGCAYEHPHYLIGAKRMEIVAEEKIVFTGAYLRFGAVRVPVPFPIVLKYQDNEYQFPDWLPEFTYSMDKGMGIRLNADYVVTSALDLAGALDITSGGGIGGELFADYQLFPDFWIHGGIGYDKVWTGMTSLQWREGQNGLTGEYLWKKEIDATKQKVALNYIQPNWQINSRLDQVNAQKWIPTAEWKTQGNLKGMDYSLVTGVTKVTEKETSLSHAKVYISNKLSDEYRLGKLGFGWSFRPTHSWVSEYGVVGSGRTDLWLKTMHEQGWNLSIGYGRTDAWGAALPEGLKTSKEEEYVSSGLAYSRRNELDEGWDLSISGQYSLEQEELTAGELKVVRALDCYDWKLNVDLVELSTKVGVQLKY